MLKKIFHTALLLCLAVAAQAQNPYVPGNLQGGPPVPGTRTRSPLNSMERAANNLAGATILTDTFGNQRLALFVRVEDTCIAYTPATTGNTQNLSAFVQKCSTDSVWYIDWTGRSIFLGSAGAVCDEDWLRISDNACPDSITDSIYHYRYAAIGARLVWPSAEFLVSDSTGAAIQILSGNRNSRLGFWDQFNQVYSTIDQSGTSTIWYISPTGEYRITTAGGGTPQSPGAPFVNQFGIDPNDLPLPTIQAYQYPNTRIDTSTVRNFVYTDNLGKLRTQPLDSLIVIITDSIAADTALQYNWYTTDATTTNPLRTATILESAQWLGDDPDGFLYFEMGSLGGGRALIDTAAALYHFGLGGLNIVQTDAQGIDIATSNTASRAVNVTTDTLNMISSFDPTLMRVNLLSDGTYFFADVKDVALGIFPNFPIFNIDGSEIGFMYSPNNNDKVGMVNGSVGNSEYQFINVESNRANMLSVSTGASSLITISAGSQVNSVILDPISASILGEFSIQQFFSDVNNYSSTTLGNSEDDDEQAAFIVMGYGASNQIDKSPVRKFAIESYASVVSSTEAFLWLEVDIPSLASDTTGDEIAFYNGAYRWENADPSPTLGDTSFHYWAGNGTTTNPGFITLAQVQAGVPNWYNSNGTTTDNTRIATVTETATWLSADAVVDGVFPFRFELASGTVNEPEMMVWKFPSDSLTLAQSDQEIFFRSTNRFLLWANNDFIVTADSISLNGTVIGANGAIKNGIVYTPFSNEIAQSGLGVFSGLEAAQSSSTVEFRQITGTAQSELFVNGSSERMILPFAGTAWTFSIRITAVCDVVGNGVGISAGETWTSWHLGGIKRVGSSTSLVGSVQTPATAQSDTGMSTSVVTIDADDTNESLRIQFTPPSTAGSTTVIRVVATVELTEIGF